MKNVKALLKRYRFFILMLLISLVFLLAAPETGYRIFRLTGNNLLEMASVLPPIFILLGLLDVWVERETMMRYMGEGSGIKGATLAFLLGSAAAGPLYAAFPIAVVLCKKGAKLSNVFLFIGAWATTKLPLLLFEAANLGARYMLIRFAFNVVGITLIAFLLEKSLKKEDIEELNQTIGNVGQPS